MLLSATLQTEFKEISLLLFLKQAAAQLLLYIIQLHSKQVIYLFPCTQEYSKNTENLIKSNKII